MDEHGRSALHYCCDNTNIDCARLLLENDLIKNNILNLQDHEGCSALHLGKFKTWDLYFFFITIRILACMNGNEIMVKYLCEQGANVELVDNESHSLIHWITGRFLKF